MIRLEAVTYTYTQEKTGRQPGQERSTPAVFQDYSWDVQHGEAWSVLGPSGCGKTTLLYLLAGLRFPNAGRILIDDQPLTRPRPHTGLILQDYGLLPWATVRQNAELGLNVRAFYGPDGTHAPADFEAQEDAAPWLERLGLTAIQDKYPAQISGGQRQRTAIARTLTLKPDLLLMDEPFSSLDAPTRQGLQNLVRDIWSEQHLTMIIVTHAIEEAAVLGSKILLLKNPPNQEAFIFDNPGAADPSFSETAQYLKLCRELRQSMETE
jgi:NitT/TauT family transport system ATP-binding protein